MRIQTWLWTNVVIIRKCSFVSLMCFVIIIASLSPSSIDAKMLQQSTIRDNTPSYFASHLSSVGTQAQDADGLVSDQSQSEDCPKAFDTFAYQAPIALRDVTFDLTADGWQSVAALPQENVDSDYAAFPYIDAIRQLGTEQELWIIGRLLNTNNDNASPSTILIYHEMDDSWEMIDTTIEATDFYVSAIYVTSENQMWGAVAWNERDQDVRNELQTVPVLSQFNENTRRFEIPPNMIELPREDRVDQYALSAILLDEQNNRFWIFSIHDTLYSYGIRTETSERHISLPDMTIDYLTLAPDDSIYFAGGGLYTMGLTNEGLFQFVPETNEIFHVETPEQNWPGFSNMLFDTHGNLWLGATGYRAPNGTWHLIHPYPQAWFDLLTNGTFSYVWSPPNLTLASSDGRLWFSRYADTSGWVDGVAWYDPETGQGCQITNAPGFVQEDQRQRLWLVSDGILYVHDQ